MAEIGELKVKLTADSSEFNKGLKDAEKSLQSAGRQGDQASKSLSASMRKLAKTGPLVAAAAVAAGAAILTKMVSAQLKAIDASAKMADKLGVSMEAMGAFEHIANLTGTSVNTLGNALQQLEVRMGQAQAGTGNAGEALNRLGFSVKEITDMEPDKAFYALAESLQGVTDRTEQAYLATELFGRGGKELLGVIRSSGDGLADMAAEAEALGLTMSRDAAAQVERFNDQMTRLRAVGEGAFRQLTVQLTPALNSLADALFDSAQDGGALHTIMSGLGSVMTGLIKVLASLIRLWDVWKSTIDRAAGAMVEAGAEMRLEHEKALLFSGKLTGQELEDQKIRVAAMMVATDQLKAENEKRIADNKAAADALKAIWQEEDMEAPVRAPRTEGRGVVGGAGTDDTAERLQALRDRLKTEEEIEIEAHEARMQELAEIDDRHFANQEERNALMVAMTEAHENELLEIRKRHMTEAERFSAMSWHRQTAQAGKELATLAQNVQGSGKKIFQIQKAGALTNAVINTYEGVSKALSAYPPPLSFAMASAQMAAGMNAVNHIRKQKYQGGGSVGGGIGATAPSATGGMTGGETGQGQRMQDIRITLDADDDSMFSGRQVRALMESMGNELQNGGNFGSFQVVRG